MQLAFRRLPIRLRLTVAFAGVLTSVLAVGGLVLFMDRTRIGLALRF